MIRVEVGRNSLIGVGTLGDALNLVGEGKMAQMSILASTLLVATIIDEVCTLFNLRLQHFRRSEVLVLWLSSWLGWVLIWVSNFHLLEWSFESIRFSNLNSIFKPPFPITSNFFPSPQLAGIADFCLSLVWIQVQSAWAIEGEYSKFRVCTHDLNLKALQMIFQSQMQSCLRKLMK